MVLLLGGAAVASGGGKAMGLSQHALSGKVAECLTSGTMQSRPSNSNTLPAHCTRSVMVRGGSQPKPNTATLARDIGNRCRLHTARLWYRYLLRAGVR